MTKPPLALTGSAVAAELKFHPVCLMFPNMNSWDFNALVSDIIHNGVLEPVWLDKDYLVIDGRHRVKACVKLKSMVPYRIIEEGDSILLAISANLARRHLTVGQRAMIAAKIANMPKGMPTANNAPIVAQASKDLSDIAGLTTEKENIAQADAANMLKISRSSVQRAHVLHSYGTPELARMVEEGKVHLTSASEIARLSLERQAEIVAKGPKGVEEAAAHHRKMVHAENLAVGRQERMNAEPEDGEAIRARREERRRNEIERELSRPQTVPSRSPAPTAPQPSHMAPGTALRIPLGYAFIDASARLLPWSVAKLLEAVKHTAKHRDTSTYMVVRLYGERV